MLTEKAKTTRNLMVVTQRKNGEWNRQWYPKKSVKACWFGFWIKNDFDAFISWILIWKRRLFEKFWTWKVKIKWPWSFDAIFMVFSFCFSITKPAHWIYDFLKMSLLSPSYVRISKTLKTRKIQKSRKVKKFVNSRSLFKFL